MRIKNIIALILSIVLLAGCAVSGTAGKGSFAAEADAYINALNNVATDERINGQVLVAKDGKILFNKGYGFADEETQEEFSENTRFIIASNSKPITATAIMQLQEKGLLSIKEPVSKYVPNQTRGDEITIEQLLTHTSGLQRDAGIDRSRTVTLKERIAQIAAQPLDFDPGTKFQYSNAAYSMLAYIIEQASGQRYEDYMKKNIFDPAGMTSTVAIPDNSALPEMAKGYSVRNSKLGKYPKAQTIEISAEQGGGSICSTVIDLYKLDRALRTDKILSHHTLKEMYEKNYGWGAVEFNGHKGVAHGGLLNGYSSQVLRLLEDDLVVVVLMNVHNQNSIGYSLAQALAGMALGEHYDPLVKKERVSLSQEELKKFAGKYQMENGAMGEIKVYRGYIALQPAGSGTNRFVPCVGNTFCEEGSEYRRLIFSSDQEGNIDGFTFQDSAVEVKLKKVEE